MGVVAVVDEPIDDPVTFLDASANRAPHLVVAQVAPDVPPCHVDHRAGQRKGDLGGVRILQGELDARGEVLLQVPNRVVP